MLASCTSEMPPWPIQREAHLSPAIPQSQHPSPDLLKAWDGIAANGKSPVPWLSIEIDRIRRPIRYAELPFRSITPIPPHTRGIQVSLPTPISEGDPGSRCRVTLRTRWGRVESEQLLPVHQNKRGPWIDIALQQEPRAEPTQLYISLEKENCAPVLVASGLSTLTLDQIEAAPTNIVLVVIDTLRRDHMDCNERSRTLTPYLYQTLCNRGVFFAENYSSAPWTYPSLGSMMTGRMPSAHGATRSGDRVRYVHRFIPTLSELLRARGYHTAAVVSNGYGERGLSRGFDTFVQRYPRGGKANLLEPRRAQYVVDEALRWLEHAPQPFFLWTLFIDIHEPVDAIRKTRVLPPACQGIAPIPLRWERLRNPSQTRLQGEDPILACRKALYAAALTYVDNELDRLLSALRERDLDRNTAVILTSDHGEEFWDHAQEEINLHVPRNRRGIDHGHTHYRELMHVPLLITPPRSWGPMPVRSSDALTSGLDVFATALAFAGIEAQPGTPSIDLRPALFGHTLGRPTAPAESSLYGPNIRSITTRRLRAILHAAGSSIFDATSDPKEKHPLPRDHHLSREAAQLLQEQFMVTLPTPGPTQADEAALRALGYVR